MNDNLTTATNSLYYTTATPATSTRTTNIYADPIMNTLGTLKYNSIQNMINSVQNITTTMTDISITIKDSNEIVKTKEIVPEMVYLFTFADGTVIKTVCDKNDIFDFEFAFYLALAKKLYSKSYTMDGIMHMARELKYQKYFVKIVNKGIKRFYKDQKEAEKEKEEERLKQERHKKFVAKKIAKKQKKKNKNNE